MGYDHREISHKWYESFDEKSMIATIETEEGETDVPCIYEVCSVCQGRGKHVNPSIDYGGLSSEDFDQDPDFRENYFSGMYDVPCVSCKGNRVTPEPDYPSMDKRLAKIVEEFIQDFFNEQRNSHYEREMGY